MNERASPAHVVRAVPLAQLLILAAAVPLLAGAAVVAAEHSGFVGRDAGTAVIALFCSVFSAAFIWVARKQLLQKERLQAEAQQALHQTRDRLDAALIASEVGTWEWDIANDRVYADQNLAAMFAVSEADANGGPLSAYLISIYADDADRLQAAIGAALDRENYFAAEYRLCSNGRVRWVLARGRIVRDASGKAIRLPGVVLDISGQRRVEADLRKSESRRRLALESAELGMWTVDPSTMKLITDARFRAIFGVQADAIEYDAAVALIHPDDRERVERAVADSSRAVDPKPYDLEYRVVLADDTVRWVHAKGRSNSTGVGGAVETSSFDGTLADITPRKEAEAERERLLQSERAARTAAERAGRIKDEFLATLSHEIRTPLSSILGWAQIMKSTTSAQDLSKGLEVIERNARAQTQIVEDLLDMSAIISGKVRLNVKELDLPSVVRVAIENAKPAADAKRIVINADIDPLRFVIVRGDAARMQQVLWNLLSNAIKFTPQQGRIDVSLKHVGKYLELTVADTGEGIAKPFLPLVFDRFRQADASTTRSYGGLGLGLSIVRQIAELHGGTARVSSPGPGLGSTFVVSLPLSQVPGDPGLQTNMPFDSAARWSQNLACSAAGDVDGLRVLVVDDEQDARDMVERLLQEQGALVTTAACAAAALEALRAHPFDVFVSDIGMPGEDGYSLMRRVRMLPPDRGGNTPGIALTAFARAEDRQHASSAGFARHLSKPVEATALLAEIAAVRRHAKNDA